MTLKELRILNNWTLEETAMCYGLDIDTIIKYENKICKFIDDENINIIKILN